MCKLIRSVLLLVLLIAISAACSGQEQAFPTSNLPSLPATSEPTQKIEPSATVDSTISIQTVTQIPLPTATPTVVLLPTLSGSGRGVNAYVREDTRQRDIYLMNADGSQKQQLTNDPNWDNWPSWSPDGAWIVFTSLTSQKGIYNNDIYKVKVDGSLMVQLTKESMVDEMCPNWRPK